MIQQFLTHSLFASGGFYLMHHFSPVLRGSAIDPIAGIGAVIAFGNSIEALRIILYYGANLLDRIVISRPQGHHGKARFGCWKDFAHDILPYGWGFYCGTYGGAGKNKGKEIIAFLESSAVIFGTAGSGKTATSVIPCVIACHDSKFIPDFKTNLAPMTVKLLLARGEIVHVVDIGGDYDPIADELASINILQIIIDDFTQSGGLESLDADLAEFVHKLLPEPTDGGGDAKFWREGSRSVLLVVIVQIILVYGEQATIGHVTELVNNRKALLNDMLWVCGELVDKNGDKLPQMPIETSPWCENHSPEAVNSFISFYRSRASEMAELLQSQDKGNMAQSFLKDAQNALKAFSPNSRANHAISRSTFRFEDMKRGDKPVTVFVTMNAAQLEQQSVIMSLVQWNFLTICKRHKNKHVRVAFISDETTNGKIENLPALLSWARESSIIIIMYIQSIGLFRQAYGKDSVSALLSETEIKIFMAGQRDPEILELIEKYLGKQSTISQSYNGDYHEVGVKGQSFQEIGSPLMDAETIRQTDKAILFLRRNKPILLDMVPFASIHPWRKQVGVNPYKKKRWLLPIRLRIGNRKPPFIKRFLHTITGGLFK